MRDPRTMKAVELVLVATTLACVCGCALLTPSQVREVKTFAQASVDYTELPGELARSYGVLLRDHKLLAVSRQEYGSESANGAVDTVKSKKAWGEIKVAYTLEREFDEDGKRMDAALKVLGVYSEMLTVLVSDKYTDDLQNSAANLAKGLDSTADAYNKAFPSDVPLQKVGTVVGQVVYGAGALYIRHRQFEILRDTVKLADPLVSNLMTKVECIASAKMGTAFANYENEFLGRQFMLAAEGQQHIEMATVSAVYDDLVRARAGVALADSVAAAARAYRKAHLSLVENTRAPMTLTQAIETVKALKKEVDAAKKIKEKVK